MKKGGMIFLVVLLIIGNAYFWTEIISNDGAGITGMATGDESSETPEGTSILIPVLLILLIAANILYLAAGKTGAKKRGSRGPKDLNDVLRLLKKTDSKTFNAHVNSELNDFADMIKIIDPGLAVKIYDITDKELMIQTIERYINKDVPEKSPEELRKEIMELKHELDTFDFGGFEKDL